jgi:GMP synthase (glutamine-hydrolysing)
MKAEFEVKKYIEETCKHLKSMTNEEVLILVSGGVDSTTSAVLLKKAGLRSRLLLIDTGFMRAGEPREVKDLFKRLGFKIILLDKKKYFYSAVRKKSDPSEKREAFRQAYFESIMGYMKVDKIKWIVQGTQFGKTKARLGHNYPTVNFFKSGFRAIEPVEHLSKNQIRKIAEKIKLPGEVIDRRPFPGPGLLIRFGGEYTPQKLFLIEKATNIVDKILSKYKNDFKNCFQMFPYLCDGLPVIFVNKKGQRDFGHILLIRAVRQVERRNIIEYHPFGIPQKIKIEIVKELMNIEKVARVCFDATPKMGAGFNVGHGAMIEYI